MPKKRIAVTIDVELDAPEPAAAFAVVLETLAQRIAHDDDPLASTGALVAGDGRVDWRVRTVDGGSSGGAAVGPSSLEPTLVLALLKATT